MDQQQYHQQRPPSGSLRSIGSGTRRGRSGSTVMRFLELFTASKSGHIFDVKRLLKEMTVEEACQLDFRRNQSTFGESPLHRAATVEIARMLVHHGVPINIRGAVGQTPLHTNDSPDVIHYLLRHDADISLRTRDGSTALHWAVFLDNIAVVKLLVRFGADVNAQNDNGNTALHMVNSLGVAKYLVDHGAKLSLLNKDNKLPLEVAASKGDDDQQIQVASFLLDASQDFNSVNISNLASRRRSPSRESRQGDEVQVVIGKIMNDDDADNSNEEDNLHNEYDENDVVVQKSSRPIPPPILKHQQSLAKAHLVTKKVDARERWRRIRSRVLRGTLTSDVEGSGEEDDPRMAQTRRQLRFALDGNRTSFASTWSEDEEDETSQSEFYASFFELMVRERPKLALKMLDRHRTFLYARGNDKIYSYDTSLIGGPTDSRLALDMIVFEERHDIISHEVVQWVLNIRWVLFTRECLLYEFFLHALFVIAFLVTTLYGEDNLFYCVKMSLEVGTMSSQAWESLFQVVLEVLIMVLNLRYLLRLLIARSLIRRKRKELGSKIRWYHSLDSFSSALPHLCVLGEQVIRLCADMEQGDLIRISHLISAVGAILLWIRLLSFAEGFEVIGVAMCTIRRMIRDILIYLFILLIFVTGYSHALALIFRGSDSPVYSKLTNSWITLYFFVFNLDVGALDDEPDWYRRYFGYIFIGIYMVVVALVILNLIIAIMTNTFEEIQENAKEQWLLQRARLILRYAQSETSLNRLSDFFSFGSHSAYFSSDEEMNYPPLPKRNIVTETSTGDVLIRVPAEWLHALNYTRQMGRHYHAFRYFCFRKWKTLRKSPSFLWPAFDSSKSFLLQKQEEEDAALEAEARKFSNLQTLGSDLSVLDEEDPEDHGNEDDNEKKQTETSPLMKSEGGRRGSFGSFISFRKAESEEEERQRQEEKESKTLKAKYDSNSSSSTTTAKLRRYDSIENAAMRTGTNEDMEFIGKFQRNPKRIITERSEAMEQTLRRKIQLLDKKQSSSGFESLAPASPANTAPHGVSLDEMAASAMETVVNTTHLQRQKSFRRFVSSSSKLRQNQDETDLSDNLKVLSEQINHNGDGTALEEDDDNERNGTSIMEQLANLQNMVQTMQQQLHQLQEKKEQ